MTLGFLITKHITRLQLLYYLTTEILGGLLGSLFVMTVFEGEADLGANSQLCFSTSYDIWNRSVSVCLIDG